jgi:hypothetical protein
MQRPNFGLKAAANGTGLVYISPLGSLWVGGLAGFTGVRLILPILILENKFLPLLHKCLYIRTMRSANA